LKQGLIKDYLHLHFLVFLWGFTAITGKLMTLDAITIVVYRTGITWLILYLWFAATNQIDTSHREFLRPIVLAGLLTTLHWVTFFGAARVANVSISLAGLSTTAFWTSIFEPIFFKRRMQYYEIGLGLVVVVALFLIFNYEIDSSLGLLISIFSAICTSLFTIINAGLSNKMHPYLITLHEMKYAFLFALPLAFIFPYLLDEPQSFERWLPTGGNWIALFFLTVICTVYAYSASIEIMKRISAFAVNLTVNLEPVYGILLALAIFGEKEKMTPGFYLGALLILVSVFCHPYLSKKFHTDNTSVLS
jgi:drug/metabolite transporter (DMT)-like permease